MHATRPVTSDAGGAPKLGRPRASGLSAEKEALLLGFLKQIPEHIATRLAKAVEVDKLAGGVGLPHDVILEGLRPQLRDAIPRDRTLTPLRVFCRPFEDLLVDMARKEKQKGRIARSSVLPVWLWLTESSEHDTFTKLLPALRDAILRFKTDDLEKKAAALWVGGAEALNAALATEEARKAAARTLGGDLVVQDAIEMALLLSAAPDITTLQQKLERPIATLTEDDIETLRSAYDAFNADARDLAPYVALIVMGRLEKPWEALKLAAIVSRKSNDTLISNTDLGIVGELLFRDMEMHLDIIQAARPQDFEAETLARHVAAFAELSGGMVKEMSIRRDGKWGQRLTKARAAVAEIMDGLMERAPRDILGALPIAKVGSYGGRGPKRLDIARPPDTDKVARAMRYAILMETCRKHATAGAFNATLKAAFEEISSALRQYGEDIVREVRAAPPEARESAEAHLAVALDLCTHILGEEETDLLRRRGKVAAGA